MVIVYAMYNTTDLVSVAIVKGQLTELPPLKLYTIERLSRWQLTR